MANKDRMETTKIAKFAKANTKTKKLKCHYQSRVSDNLPNTRPEPRPRVFLVLKGHTNTMKQEKLKKQQDDRLLKRLSRQDRRRQEELRRLITVDPLFKTV